MFSIFLLVYILVAALFVQQQLTVIIAKFKEVDDPRLYVKALIPVYGFIYFNNMESMKETQGLIDRRTIWRSIARNLVLVFFPVFTIYLYISGFSEGGSIVPKFTAFYFTLVLIFTQQSLAVSIAEKKGLSSTKAGFIGLLPVYGLYYYIYAKPVRSISRTAIPMIIKTKNITGTMFIYMEMILLASVVILPILYIVGTSLNPNAGILNTMFPDEPSFQAFRFLFTEKTSVNGEDHILFPLWYWNTLKVALMTMVGAVLFVTGTAYVFARYNFKGKKAGLMTILILQMFPSFLSLIAIFTLFSRFGLTNNPNALVIIYVAGGIPFNIWLIKGYLQNIPKELDESAKIDGANKVQIFFKIILPLSVPIISFVAVTSFMAPWMDFILPSYLIIDQDKWTLAVGIFDWINNPSNINYPAFAAAALIVAIPITVLYIVFQRYLIEGITAGANKG